MTDTLDRAIEALAADIAERERSLEQLRFELAALKRAAAMRPAVGRGKTARGGKVTGTVSMRWRSIMQLMVEDGNEPSTETHWQEQAKVLGFYLNRKAVLDWLLRGSGARMGYIECVDSMFRVSQSAIDRFGFKVRPARIGPAPEPLFDAREFRQ